MTDEILTEYEDALGERQTVDPRIVARLRSVIGAPDEAAAQTPSVLFVRPGAKDDALRGQLVLEDGATLDVRGALPRDAPFGYHRLSTDAGHEVRVITSPGTCHMRDRRAWGWAVQLYAARSASSWGIGDLGDLATLARRSAALDAGFLMVNPLHASAPTLPQQPSPYSPTSRRFFDPLYLRIEDVPGAARLGHDLERVVAEGRALNEAGLIQRDAAFRLKEAVLRKVWEQHRSAAVDGFETWLLHQRTSFGPGDTDSLRDFATWNAIAEQHGPDWRRWPAGLRRPDDPAVRQFAREHHGRVDFHMWVQWLLHRQLAAAATHLGIIQDLPIGFDPDGADAWAWQDELALDVTVGAPPDEFNTTGQDWGLPPFVPWKLRRAGYGPFIETVRATIAAAGRGGGLRIDHVMGLFRLWWVPPEGSAADGAYVRSRADDLLDIVALESHRADAVVIGEDLGTVEPGVRERLAERNVLSYRLLWFEDDPPSTWPRRAMAAITTHDLPTVAGLWDGTDLTVQGRLELRPNVESTEAIRARLAERCSLAGDASNADAVRAAHHLLADAPCTLLVATLEDAIAEADRPNMPGAEGRRPNWCLPLAVPVDGIDTHPLAREVADTLRRAITDGAAG